jgi:hypothetical protein
VESAHKVDKNGHPPAAILFGAVSVKGQFQLSQKSEVPTNIALYRHGITQWLSLPHAVIQDVIMCETHTDLLLNRMPLSLIYSH